jgi:hypothetical protein
MRVKVAIYFRNKWQLSLEYAINYFERIPHSFFMLCFLCWNIIRRYSLIDNVYGIILLTQLRILLPSKSLTSLGQHIFNLQY